MNERLGEQKRIEAHGICKNGCWMRICAGGLRAWLSVHRKIRDDEHTYRLITPKNTAPGSAVRRGLEYAIHAKCCLGLEYGDSYGQKVGMCSRSHGLQKVRTFRMALKEQPQTRHRHV